MAFLPISSGIDRPRSLAIDASGNLWVNSLYAVYKRVGGTFTYIMDSSDPENTYGGWGICVLPNGNVVVAIADSRIAILTGGQGTPQWQAGTAANWRHLWCDASGTLWGAVYNGYIMKSTDGGATWTQASQNTGTWMGGVCQGSDIYAGMYNGSLYKQTGGVGNFVEIADSSNWWTQIVRANDGHLIAAIQFFDPVEQLTKDGPWSTLGTLEGGGIGIVQDQSGGIYLAAMDIYYQAPAGGGTTYEVSVSETVSESENLGIVRTAIQGINESSTVSEQSQIVVGFNLPLSDSFSKTELVGGLFHGVIGVSESHGAAESLLSNLKANAGVNESVSLTDLAIPVYYTSAGVNESSFFADSLSSVQTCFVGLADGLGLVESLLAGQISFASFSDSLSLLESNTASVLVTALLSETFSHSDGIGSGNLAILGLSDSFTISENVATDGSITYSISLSDSSSILDGITSRVLSTVSTSDNVSLSQESLTAAMTALQAVYESVGVSDSIALQAKYYQDLIDGASVVEGVVGGLNFTANVSDSLSTTDELNQTLRFNVSLLETSASSDSITLRYSADVGLSDSLAELEVVFTNDGTVSAKVLINGAWRDVVSLKVLKDATWHPVVAKRVLKDGVWRVS